MCLMKGNCAFILSPILKMNLFPTKMMTSKEEIALINVQGFFSHVDMVNTTKRKEKKKETMDSNM